MNIVNDFKSNLPEQSTGLDLSSRSEAPFKIKVRRRKKKKVKKEQKKKVKKEQKNKSEAPFRSTLEASAPRYCIHSAAWLRQLLSF